MHVVFLGARLPLTKSFHAPRGTQITAEPYPHVAKVTSYHEDVKNLCDFKDALIRHAALGHCLFNGHLDSPLVEESRAGHTLKQNRDWIVLDFDKVIGKNAEDVIKRYLPKYCQDVSYVVQLSASMFRPDTTLWSGHIYMLLKSPIEETKLKQWFEYLNFSQPNLVTSLKLSDSLHALHWPLDRTVAYGSKLIYIAPPKCYGFDPAIDQHITYVKKRQSHLAIPAFQPIDSYAIRAKVNELRRAIGAPDIEYSTVLVSGEEIQTGVGECTVDDVRRTTEYYIRFNLNGGDSLGYFIDLRNPALIRNFKGEPSLRTKEVAPSFYSSLLQAKTNAVARGPMEDGAEVLAIYATNRGSQITIGLYEPLSRKLRLDPSSEKAAHAWRAQHGVTTRTALPHMEVIFNPKVDVPYIPGIMSINTFKVTKYMAHERTSKAPSTLADLPPVVEKTIRSMLGNPNIEVLTHFINWLAFVFQYREKTGTAWVLHGRTGTGKSVFREHILTPIFGAEQVRSVPFYMVASNFNDFLEKSLFVFFEEADINSVASRADLMMKLKHWITDNPVEIHTKGLPLRNAPNYCNFFFNTNEPTPVVLTKDDRRFNVAERQERKLEYTPNEWLVIQGREELDAFADVLQRWPVDAAMVKTPIRTQAAKDMHEACTGINALVAEAIQRGDLQYFIERMPNDIEAAADFGNRFNPLGLFKTKMGEFIEAAQKGEVVILNSDDLFVLFRMMIPDPRYFQDSKVWRLRHFKSLGLKLNAQHRKPGDWDKTVRGVKVKWKLPRNIPSLAPPNNVILMKEIYRVDETPEDDPPRRKTRAKKDKAQAESTSKPKVT